MTHSSPPRPLVNAPAALNTPLPLHTQHSKVEHLHHFGSRLPSTLPELLECATRLLAAAQEVNNSS